MNNASIVLLIPYFGRWPFWMPLFLKSCRYNPDIQWILYSDCGEPTDLPSNVRYVDISFSDYCKKVSDRLGFVFNPERAYKLCDLKPALGFVHEDDIHGFDFWGFSDLDLLYGRLRDYFTAEKLARYDFFSTHERRVSGHLCLMRNNERMRTAFWRVKKFEQLLCDQENHRLDEGAFSRIFLKRKNFPKPLFRLVGLFNPWRRKAVFEELYSTPNAGRPWMDGTNNFPEAWYWRRGVLTSSNTGEKTFPYFHFYGWKKYAWDESDMPDYKQILDLAARGAWMIDDKGFHALPLEQEAERVVASESPISGTK